MAAMAAVVAAVAAAVAASASGASGNLGVSKGSGTISTFAGRGVESSCTPVTNVEAIVDDSGSMSGTDRNRLRVAALDLFVSKPQNANKTLGAVEFGSQADSLFAPEPIGRNAASMKSILNTKIRADNGATNYNDAFSLAKTDNANAKARIFLTDGGHNVGIYANGHQNGPPTYVIGLTIGPATPGDADASRLQQIADETGGKYYPEQDASTLQATVNEISATLDCQQAPLRVVDTFTSQGQARSHSIAILKGIRTVELTSTWSDPTNKFALTGLRIGRGKVLGRRIAGATYLVVRITNPPRGTLRFKVTASRLVTGTASVITQIARNRSGSGAGASTTAQLRTFVDRIESALRRSAVQRRNLSAALKAGFNCSISSSAAAQRIARVAAARKTILVQLGGFQAPTQQADIVLRLLKRVLRESITADQHYRDGFLAVGNTGCPLPANANFKLAARSDARATAAKQHFVAAFNPLARRFHRRTWSAGKI
jgi:hypothetical protein